MSYEPKTEAELADCIAGLSGPVRLVGGDTRRIGRCGGERLSLAGLSGVQLYEPGALTLVAQAGTPLSEIETMLAGENQRLAFEPMDHRVLQGSTGTPTIGGVVAGNVSGPRRIALGACRDFTLGVRFVDGAGRVLKNGGRVMKNVTGYDLVKLMSGSFGTLGALSEVSLKVLPTPETEVTLVFDGLHEVQAVALMSAGLGSPYDVTGAAHVCGAQSYLRLEGFSASVTARAANLSDKLKHFGAAELLCETASKALWADIRDQRAFADHAVVVRASVAPSAAEALLAAARAVAAPDATLDWGGGLVWVALKSATAEEAVKLINALQAYCARNGGHATLIKAPEATYRQAAAFQPESRAVTTLSAGLRRKFDPNCLLNPNLMGPL